MLASGSIVSIFAQPFWGYISDKNKTVTRVLLFTITSALISSIGIFTAGGSVTVIFIMMLIFTFFISAAPPLSDSLSISYAHAHGRSYGSIRLWGAVGIGISSLVLGSLTQKFGIGNLGYMYAAILIAVLTSALFLRDTAKSAVPVTKQALLLLFRNRSFLWFLFLVLVIAIPHRMNDGLLGIYLSQIGASESQVGIAWMIATLSSVPAFALMGILLRRFYSMHLFVISGFIYALRWALYSLADDPATLILLQFIHCVTFPVFFVSAIDYLTTKLVPDELRSTGQATFTAVLGGVAGFAGSAGGGWIMDELSPQIAYGTGSILALVGSALALITMIWSARQLRKSKAAET
jgi:PPP family 3-phenylpropionic acid transporter